LAAVYSVSDCVSGGFCDICVEQLNSRDIIKNLACTNSSENKNCSVLHLKSRTNFLKGSDVPYFVVNEISFDPEDK
jgi:hypothetical protein